ncbi:calcium/calmodulin-dependent protein kinase type IV-like [Styela clava]
MNVQETMPETRPNQEFWFKSSQKDISFEELYQVGSEIGRGATSIVHKCKQKGTGKAYAVKMIPKSIEKKIVGAEVGILLTLKHPNIIKLKDIFETPEHIYLILELVTGGELFDRIVERGYYSELDAAHVVRQALEAVAYIHDNNIVHRDLKPENLLYSDETDNAALMVADFGLSKINQNNLQLKTVCGTPGYVAPEVLLGKKYGSAVDMWAIGVITYILLCGYEPFYDERGDKAMFRKVLKGEFEFDSPNWDEISGNAKDLIRRLIVLEPSERLTARQALKHPWVMGEAANYEHMETTVTRLKTFNAKRKLKAVFNVVAASNRMSARSPSTSTEEPVKLTDE